jgi:hypothetical protein
VDLIHQLEDQVVAFVDERASLDDLAEWLSNNAPELAAIDDAGATLLNGRAWTLVSEYGYGHRSEASARRELAKLLRRSAPSKSVQPSTR